MLAPGTSLLTDSKEVFIMANSTASSSVGKRVNEPLRIHLSSLIISDQSCIQLLSNRPHRVPLSKYRQTILALLFILVYQVFCYLDKKRMGCVY